MEVTENNDSRSCGKLSLWIGLLGPPILWLIQFQLNYSLVPYAAITGNTLVLPGSAAGFLLLSLACGIRPLASWHAQREAEKKSGVARQCRQFIALIAIGMVAIFSSVIAWQGIAALSISPRIEAR